MQPVKTSVCILLGLLLLAGCASTQENDILENKVPGTATLTGTVTAPRPFKPLGCTPATRIKTSSTWSTRERAAIRPWLLFPGPYEVWVEKTGFESDRQEFQIEAGEVLNVDFSLTESGPQSAGQGSFMGLDRAAAPRTRLFFPMMSSILRLPSGP